jgi:TPP-dependent pyruvate/acetoin dehydrogenase alpha subunit
MRANVDVSKIADSLGVNSMVLNGNDVKLIYEETCFARDFVITNRVPFFMQLNTYRLSAHTGIGEDIGWGLRTQEEINEARKLEPLSLIDKVQLSSLIWKAKEEIWSAYEIAKTMEEEDELRW